MTRRQTAAARAGGATEGATHQKEVVVLGLRTKVLEDRLLPISLHVIPIIYLTMSNRIIDAITGGLSIRQCFVADEEVKILDTTL